MKDLLSELKDACKGEPPRSDVETIRSGQSTWFRGRPVHAPDGAIALSLSDEARVIINEADVREVSRHGDDYNVAVSADANFLFRVEKVVKATVGHCCKGGSKGPVKMKQSDGGAGPITDIDIGPVEVCDLICFDWVVGGISFPVCVTVNCRVEKS